MYFKRRFGFVSTTLFRFIVTSTPVHDKEGLKQWGACCWIPISPFFRLVFFCTRWTTSRLLYRLDDGESHTENFKNAKWGLLDAKNEYFQSLLITRIKIAKKIRGLSFSVFLRTFSIKSPKWTTHLMQQGDDSLNNLDMPVFRSVWIVPM